MVARRAIHWGRRRASSRAVLQRRPAPPDWNPGEREELARQLRELEKHSPPFDPAAQLADCRWLAERQRAGELEPYRGKHIVVLNGRIVGAAEDALGLQLDLAREYGVHPDQITVEYIFPPGFWWGFRGCPS